MSCRRPLVRFEGLPDGFPSLGECPRAFLLVRMTPHRYEGAATGAARIGEPELERSPQRLLGGAHRGGRVARDLLGELLGGVEQTVGRVDDTRPDADLSRARGAA